MYNMIIMMITVVITIVITCLNSNYDYQTFCCEIPFFGLLFSCLLSVAIIVLFIPDIMNDSLLVRLLFPLTIDDNYYMSYWPRSGYVQSPSFQVAHL